jgi:hypothetical protein
VWVAFADHFEPRWRGADLVTARQRVELWRRGWPEIARRWQDAAGRPPTYTYFFPEEQYHPLLLEPLAEMAAAGIADVEVHLHHDGEGAGNFVDRLSSFTESLYYRHGLLRKEADKITFGFIHGNWALDNSLPDGKWCGLNNELTLLRKLGCYADFTLPSAPSPAQTRLVNTIYWATDDPDRPKSHDTGVPVAPGSPGRGDLLMIPGPLGFNFWERPLRPRLETGELAAHHRPSMERARLWLRLAPRIGDDVFVKLFAHGAPERNAAALLQGDLQAAIRRLLAAAGELGSSVHFVSAWQMRQVIEAVCRGSDPQEAVTRRPALTAWDSSCSCST